MLFYSFRRRSETAAESEELTSEGGKGRPLGVPFCCADRPTAGICRSRKPVSCRGAPGRHHQVQPPRHRRPLQVHLAKSPPDCPQAEAVTQGVPPLRPLQPLLQKKLPAPTARMCEQPQARTERTKPLTLPLAATAAQPPRQGLLHQQPALQGPQAAAAALHLRRCLARGRVRVRLPPPLPHCRQSRRWRRNRPRQGEEALLHSRFSAARRRAS